MVTSTGNCLPVWLSVASPVCLFVPEPLSWVLACWQGTWHAGWSASAVGRHSPCTAGQWLPLTWFLTFIRPSRTFSIDCTGSKEGPVACRHRILCTKTCIALPLWHKPSKGQRPCLMQKGSKKTTWWTTTGIWSKNNKTKQQKHVTRKGKRSVWRETLHDCPVCAEIVWLCVVLLLISCSGLRFWAARYKDGMFEWLLLVYIQGWLNCWYVFSLLQLCVTELLVCF